VIEGGNPTSRSEALALARWLETAVNAHDVAALTDRYAENAVLISPVFRETVGRAAIRRSWEEIFNRFPDWQVKTLELLVDGDRLAFVGTCTATDRNGWFGLPPTGETFSYRAVILLTLRDDKIVRDQRMYDLTSVLEHLEKTQVDRELKTAGQVQSALLSRRLQTGEHYEAFGDSIACRTIGGDFYEALELPSGDLGIVLGDVAGKGPPAALLAAMLQGMFTVEGRIASTPRRALANANAVLSAKPLAPRFATLVYGVLSRDGNFTYSNAGHNPPILLGGSGIRHCEIGGPLLGAFRDTAFEEQTLRTEPGDALVLFTDGVIESRNAAGEEFGEERMVCCVESLRRRSAVEIATGLLDAVREFSCRAAPDDDITVAVVRRL